MKRLTRMFAACLVLAVLLGQGAFAAGINDSLINFQTDTVYAINQARDAIRVGALTLDSQLNECARILAKEMEGLNGDEANRPNGKAWDTVLDEQGYYVDPGLCARNRYVSATEIDSAALADYWLNNSGLRSNALNSAYTRTGVYGYYSTQYDKYYVVQLFAKPAKVEAAGYTAVAERDLYVYDGPSANRSVIWLLSRGNEIYVQSIVGGWAKFTVSNTTGYAQSAYLTRKTTLTPTPTPKPTATPLPTPAPAQKGNFEATTGVNVRSGPGTGFAVIGGVDKGNRVSVTGSVGVWYKITWNSSVAYVHSAYFRPVGDAPYPQPQPPSVSGERLARAKSNVNVRSGPSTRYKRLGTLYKGEAVTVRGYEGNWARVRWRGYASVYVSKSYLAVIQ